MKIEVRKLDVGWGLFVNGHHIGTSKDQVTAMFHKNMLDKAANDMVQAAVSAVGPYVN